MSNSIRTTGTVNTILCTGQVYKITPLFSVGFWDNDNIVFLAPEEFIIPIDSQFGINGDWFDIMFTIFLTSLGRLLLKANWEINKEEEKFILLSTNK